MPVRIDDFHDRWSRVRDHDSVASLGVIPTDLVDEDDGGG